MLKFSSSSDSSRSYNDKKKLVINYLRSHQYGQIKALIGGFSSREVETFFQKCGYGILSYAIINADDIDALGFIVNIVKEGVLSEQTMREILRCEEFDILKNCLIGRSAQEEYYGEYAQDKNELMIEKLKLLFEVDPLGMRNFLTNNQSEYYMSGTIKEDFKKIVESKKIVLAI